MDQISCAIVIFRSLHISLKYFVRCIMYDTGTRLYRTRQEIVVIKRNFRLHPSPPHPLIRV